MQNKSKADAGFSLIEILVAIFIVVVGLLQLSYLQTVVLRNNQTAYLRSQAAVLAYDMSDRLKANEVGVANGSYNSIASAPGSPPNCNTSVCTSAQIATYDAAQWYTTLGHRLPGGSGSVTGNGANSNFTITVTWQERGQAGRGQLATNNFVMQVMP